MEEVQEQDQPDSGEGEEQSTEDQATSEETGVESAGGDEDESESEATELIPREKYDELKSDPDKLHKELVRAANIKFREAAAQRKAIQPYAEFIQALDRDPRKATMALGKQLGLKIDGADADEGVAADKVKNQIETQVRQALGPEYEDLADRLIPAIQFVADSAIQSALRPVLSKQEEMVMDSATRSSQAAMDAFAKRNPGWNKHEEAMVALSAKLPPGKGVTEGEYLDMIYALVTRDTNSGDAVRRTVDRMKKSAGESSSRSSTVSGDKVTKRPNKPPTFTEAAEAAIRGERFE